MLKYDEEVIKEILDEADAYFTQYKSDREEIDDLMRLDDYMYAAAQNRSLMSSEKKKGMNLEKDERANVGSTMFHRQVNMLAAQLVNVVNSQTDLVKYQTIGNEIDPASFQDSKQIAEQMQVLQRYTRKRDQFDLKLPELAVNAFKKSTIFVMMTWCSKQKTLKKKIPVAKSTTSDDGTVKVDLTERIVSQKLDMGYPSMKLLDPKQVYADRWIPCMEQQNCVIVTEMKNRGEIAGMVNEGLMDKDQYLLLTDDFYWNNADDTEVEENEALNRELERSTTSKKMFKLFHVFISMQMKDGKLNEEEDPEMYYLTVIGNALGDGILMSIDPLNEFDPDGEIPIRALNVSPDKSGELYHTNLGAVIRSCYSADCTLLNLSLDNMGAVNDPPLRIIDGLHRVTDFTFKKGQRWHMDDPSAITQFELRDVTQNTSILREQVRKEAMQALATDSPMMGEFAGSRTSATEFMGVNQNTKQPHLVQINYILQQLLPWWGRKVMSYWMYHGKPEQVLQITDMDKQYIVQANISDVSFDVEVNIVQEYIDDMVRQQQLSNIMQMIGASPFFQQSEHHSVNAGELLKKWLNTMRWPANEIITTPEGVDAEALAHYNVNTILTSGQYIRPNPASNLAVHLRVARGEEVRWRGLEGSGDPRAANLPLLQQYIQEIVTMQSQRQMGAPGVPQGPQNETPGEVQGNEVAGALGALG